MTIITKYIPATNRRGSRIRAKNDAGESCTIAYPHAAAQGPDAHWMAAAALLRTLGRNGKFECGQTELGYVFVQHLLDNYYEVKE